ncbi:MAG: 50S ribosomal protein L29 [Desulfurococcales archaeon]|jgi:large subunit ribosomal protein L29|nr:50S ribosomal protein L29 [Desulfurococcales archaeon]
MSLDPDEIRSMSREEKLRTLQDLMAELAKLRAQASMGTLDKPHKMRITRKNIARILTILREEELGISRRKEGAEGEEKKE